MQRHHRHLDAETDEEAGENQQLHRQRQTASALGHVAHRKAVAGRRVIKEEQRHQHEHRTAQRIQEEIERRLLPVGATETVDQEEQRNQRRFPEHVEQRPVAGGKDAEHCRFEQQYQHKIQPRPGLHAPRHHHRDQRQQCGEDHHRQRQAVDAKRKIGTEADIPRPGFGHLDGGAIGIEGSDQPASPGDGSERKEHRQMPERQRPPRRHDRQQAGTHHRQEHQHLQQPGPSSACRPRSFGRFRL